MARALSAHDVQPHAIGGDAPTKTAEAVREFADDVRRGLTSEPKTLSCRWLYDDLGSRLFEAICGLPWYPITRAETALLTGHAAAMVAPFADPIEICELGPGSGEKLAILAGALGRAGREVTARLVDISETALALAQSTLAKLPNVRVIAHAATYDDGLAAIAEERRGPGSRLALFLGSNIGNFEPDAALRLFAKIRGALRLGDGLLLGADLVRSERDLVLAYDDPLGVTAAFDKNLLVRLNRELGADADLAAFDHRAVWNADASRVEMHLVSRRPQTLRIPGAGIEVALREGETIWTESSYKYTPDRVIALGRAVGLACHAQWVDPDARFSATLFVAT